MRTVRKSRKASRPGRMGPTWSGREREGGGDEVVTEAQRQLRELLGRQMDTSTFSLQRTLRAADSMFTSPVTYQAQEVGVAPLRSVQGYRSDQKAFQTSNNLREAGLSEKEVEMVLGAEGGGGRVKVEPSAMQGRISAVQEKLSGHVAQLKEMGGVASGVLTMSRHAWELEQSLHRCREDQTALHHLVTHNRTRSPRTIAAFPAKLLPGKEGDEEEENEEERETGVTAHGATVQPLPLQLIERNRLTPEQIKKLPHFANYSSGNPSSVLYIKNIHRKTTLDDLSAIFGHWQDGVWPKIRLLTGRLGGQAFAEFQDVGVASEALEAVNGYVVREKPLVISYGHQQSQHNQAH
ncbi:RNA-binding protein 41 [Geodia barretti]|uniref:RNA-binding protein 41 n=1 Tax=Geodia barretti TaxID=519541 RepID=A0AA35QZ15_GEOBA|nr:RNA-binding protein 41 [Geodia barretti]